MIGFERSFESGRGFGKVVATPVPGVLAESVVM
jgi:hypothetical protein